MISVINLMNNKRTWVYIWLQLTLYSIVVHFIAWRWQFHILTIVPFKHYNGYFQKPNWALTPLYWSFVIPFAYYTWEGFISAWRDLPRTNVLHRNNSGEVTYDDIESLILKYNITRLILLLLAIPSAIIVNVVDVFSWAPCFLQNKANVCMESGPDFNVVWIYLGSFGSSVYYKNLLFDIFAYINQFILTLLGFLSLYQITFHLFIFSMFERFKFFSRNQLSITLNWESPLGEFGLEGWNNTLNNIYWLLSAVLVVPLISRFSQPPGEMSNGQIMIQIFVPILFAIPIVFTIIQRQVRLPEVWHLVRDSKDISISKKYHDQKIWPLDKNWSSKLGILIATTLLMYLLGVAKYDELLKKLF